MLGSCLMIGLKSTTLSKKEKQLIISQKIFGIILFKRNIESLRGLYDLCLEIKSLTDPAPLIAIDLEGGAVNRLSHLKQLPAWPSPKILRSYTTQKIENIAYNIGQYLFYLGIDINLAPVVDLLITENTLLKDRVLGLNPDEILKKAGAFVKGLNKANILACLKHFPSHGGVIEDSHKTFPKDFRSLKDIEDQLGIFQKLFKKYSCWIMTAHIKFPNIDNQACCFSKQLLQAELQKNLGFKQTIISDDIDMDALKEFSPEDIFFKSIKAGCHLVLACQKEESPLRIFNDFKLYPEKYTSLQKALQKASKHNLKIQQQHKPKLMSYNKLQQLVSRDKNISYDI